MAAHSGGAAGAGAGGESATARGALSSDEAGAGQRGGGGAPSTGPHSASASGLSTPSRGALLGPDDDDDDELPPGLDGGAELELETGDVVNGALDDDEDAQLNPLRTAYMRGWERAVKEEQEG